MFKIFIFIFIFFTALSAENSTNFEVLMYEDKSNSLTFEDIQKVKEFRVASNSISTGYSNSSFWLKFDIQNSEPKSVHKFIKFTENFIHELECYIVSSDGTYLSYRNGIGYFKDGEVNKAVKPLYEIQLKKGEIKTVYIRFFGLYSNYFSFNIFNEKELYKYTLKYNEFYSLYIGAVSALILYNLFIFLFNREKVYFYYTLYASTFLIWQLQLNEYVFFNTYSSSWVFYTSGMVIPLWISFVTLFAREILEVQNFSKKLDTIVKYLAYTYLVLAFSSIFFLHTSFVIINALASFSLPFLLYVGYKSYQYGNKTAIFFIIAQASFLSMSTIFSLMTEGYIEYSLLSRHGIVVGSMVEMILFSIALGYRLKVLRDKERDLLQNLELKVKERTAEQENIFNVTMEAIGIYEDGKLIELNSSAVAMYGYENKKEILGKSPFLLVAPSSRELVKKNVEQNYEEAYEITALKKDDTEFPALVKGTTFKIEERQLRVVSVLDYTLVKENERELKRLASIDPMTKLFNRRYFTEMSESLLDLGKRNKVDTAIIMIDIDKFKNVNDTYGHKTGDDVIISLSNFLQEQSRKSDIVCRWGGEEFVMLLPSTDLKGALVIAEKIRGNVENLLIQVEDRKSLRFTVSIGVSVVENDANIENSIKQADKGLYEAKNSGRNKVCYI